MLLLTDPAGRRALGGVLLLALAACTAFDTPDTYNRHRLSDITLPRDPQASAETFFFDVTVSAEFPESSATAEAARMKWLAEWLVQRHMCVDGHEVLGKRAFGEMEDNPARRNLRYEVRCMSAGAADAPQ